MQDRNVLGLARRRLLGLGDSAGGGLGWVLEEPAAVAPSWVMHSSSHQGAAATQNPGRRDTLGSAKLCKDAGRGCGGNCSPVGKMSPCEREEVGALGRTGEGSPFFGADRENLASPSRVWQFTFPWALTDVGGARSTAALS